MKFQMKATLVGAAAAVALASAPATAIARDTISLSLIHISEPTRPY